MNAENRTAGGDVVVGLDNSASARAAVGWAQEWARRIGGVLRVVHAQEPPLAGPPMGYPFAPWRTEFRDPQREERERNRAAIDRLFHDLVSEPDWSLEFVDGHAGPALVRASRTAALLVVGTRRLGAIERLGATSVSGHCVRHADCPVLVVPANRPYPTSDAAAAKASIA